MTIYEVFRKGRIGVVLFETRLSPMRDWRRTLLLHRMMGGEQPFIFFYPHNIRKEVRNNIKQTEKRRPIKLYGNKGEGKISKQRCVIVIIELSPHQLHQYHGIIPHQTAEVVGETRRRVNHTNVCINWIGQIIVVYVVDDVFHIPADSRWKR